MKMELAARRAFDRCLGQGEISKEGEGKKSSGGALAAAQKKFAATTVDRMNSVGVAQRANSQGLGMETKMLAL
jgi:hypothetical protein